MMLLPPPSGIGGIALTGAQVFMTAASYLNEKTNATAYSKFAQAAAKSNLDIPSKAGMLLIYGPAFVVATTLGTSFASALLAAHFGKRNLEVLFLHKYSGTVAFPTAAAIGTYYALITWLIASLSAQTTAIALPALACFAIGELGNFYHHALLANLRKGNTKGYVVPTGGLFDYAAAPHYAFEILAWFGIALAAQQVNAFLVATCMASYLSGRAVAQNNYNADKFKDKWPKDQRANMIPFVF